MCVCVCDTRSSRCSSRYTRGVSVCVCTSDGPQSHSPLLHTAWSMWAMSPPPGSTGRTGRCVHGVITKYLMTNSLRLAALGQGGSRISGGGGGKRPFITHLVSTVISTPEKTSRKKVNRQIS